MTRLGSVREACLDVLRLWKGFLKDNPAALTAARDYGSKRCLLDDKVANDWTLRLGRLFKVEADTAVKLKGKFGGENAPM